MKEIKFWTNKGEYGFLSNFFYAPYQVGEFVYLTNEHYFQSKKFEGTEWEHYIRNLTTPAETAREGKRRDLPLRPHWDWMKEEVMFTGLYYKFTFNPDLADKLLETGRAILIENSPYDYYWGIGKDGSGKNRLGNLLMILRSELYEKETKKVARGLDYKAYRED